MFIILFCFLKVKHYGLAVTEQAGVCPSHIWNAGTGEERYAHTKNRVYIFHQHLFYRPKQRESERERESEQRNQRGREHDRVGCHSVTSTSKHGVYQAPLPYFHTFTHTNTLTDSDYCIYITTEAFHILNFSFTFKSIPIQSFVRLTFFVTFV